MGDILVFCEQHDGAVGASSLGLLEEAARIAGELGAQVGAVVCGQGLDDAQMAAPRLGRRVRHRARAADPAHHQRDVLDHHVGSHLAGRDAAAHELADRDDEVLLTVPKVSLLSRPDAIRLLAERESHQLVAVHQIFDGDITGRALLIFPEAKSLELVRAVVGGELSLEEIIELEQEALAETGNVILNSCLATMANSLGRTLKISLPEVLRGDSSRFFSLNPPPPGGATIMFIYINFTVRSKAIEGYIAMMMDMPSLAALQTLLQEYIERETGEKGG